MFITIITDCADANARGRQETRIRTLFDVTPSFVPVSGALDTAASLEASGNIVDVLDAAGDAPGIILANVAPRQGEERCWGNGTPFGFFRYKQVLACTTVSGAMLTLPRKLGLIERYDILNLPETLACMVKAGGINPEQKASIEGSQFRSFDFLPRVAHFLHAGGVPAAHEHFLDMEPPHEPRVWAIDNFGNVKTTMLARELPDADSMATRWGALPIVPSLKDVSDGSPALTVGSSGIGGERFVEVVIQGASMADQYGVSAGDPVLPQAHEASS